MVVCIVISLCCKSVKVISILSIFYDISDDLQHLEELTHCEDVNKVLPHLYKLYSVSVTDQLIQLGGFHLSNDVTKKFPHS